MSMFAAAAAAVLVSMLLVLIRAFRGPTVFDRILAINSFGTLTVLLIAVHGYLAGRPEFLDLALVYALINFIGTIAVTRFVRYRELGNVDGSKEHHGDI
jgi:multicomponent Na+:H+ antiporter subunit F